MDDKLIQRAVKCYTEKLGEENKTLKEFMKQIEDAFKMFYGKSRTTDEIIKDIIDILRVYHNVFKEGAP